LITTSFKFRCADDKDKEKFFYAEESTLESNKISIYDQNWKYLRDYLKENVEFYLDQKVWIIIENEKQEKEVDFENNDIFSLMVDVAKYTNSRTDFFVGADHIIIYHNLLVIPVKINIDKKEQLKYVLKSLVILDRIRNAR